MKRTYPITSISRESILLPEGATKDSHRGVYFYDPKTFESAEVGDVVEFTCCGEVVAIGMVCAIAHREDYPKWCSGINSSGFLWTDIPESHFEALKHG